MSVFKEGSFYTRNQINQELGGNKQTYLPTVKGRVVCACITDRLNQMGPTTIYVGQRPKSIQTAEILCAQGGSVPVFVKKAVNKWEYQGDFVVDRTSQASDELKKHGEIAGRKLTKVITLKRSRG